MYTENRRMRIMRFLIPILLFAAVMACQISFGSPSQPIPEPLIMEVVVTATTEVVSAPAEESELPPQPPEPEYLKAGEPLGSENILKDVDGSLLANEKVVSSGDYFLEGLYERPFTSVAMQYLPDVDIQTLAFEADTNFYYFTITLKVFDPTEKRLTGSYGIELDRGLKGRGDFLVWGHDFATVWSTQNLTAYVDLNRDVGGLNPWIANEGHVGDGYETALAFAGDKVAYARLAPDGSPAVQFAVSRALLDGADEFLYGAVADRGWQNPGRFEYNDFIGPTAAGSPIKGAVNYPVKDLFGLDNTCRRAFGFAPNYVIRGMCTSKPVIEEKPGESGGCPVPVCSPGCWVVGCGCDCIK